MFASTSLMMCGALVQAPIQMPAQAQTLGVAAVESSLQTVEIPVRNVDPALLAYWFDAPHQPMPAMIRRSLASGGQIGRSSGFPYEAGNGNGPENLSLPLGVASIAGAEGAKFLTATGTKAGLEMLRKRVAELDVPLRYVEIEAQFMQMKPADLASLKIPFGAPKKADVIGSNAVKAGFMPSPATLARAGQVGFINYPSSINALIASDKIRVISAPRVRVADGLTGALEARGMNTFLAGKTDANTNSIVFKGPDGKEFGMPRGLIIQQNILTGLKATPMIRDGFVDLDMQITFNNHITPMSTIFQNGQTLAIQLPRDNDKSDWITIAFVTPRIEVTSAS